ncbi:MAG: alkaline phosphatase D family protein [Pirellulaceae bacterium]|nr:alkaline phosphatase D family protein [Pirellulaceae bacterium]
MRKPPTRLAAELVSHRREFILAGASLSVLPWTNKVAKSAIFSPPRFDLNPFTLGVASGEPEPDGMVLWTRLAPRPLEGGGLPPEIYEVTWELASDDQMRNVVQRGKELATPQLGHSVHVEVHGLPPDRWYWYRFTCGDAQSSIGRTRTTPAIDVMPDRFRFAFASCQSYEQGLFTCYDHLQREDLDLVVHLGDYIYEYGGKDKQVRRHTEGEIESLDDYRNRYAQYRTDEHLQAAHARFPWLVVWDDHEVDNNYANDISEEKSVDREALLLRRANAYQAFYESMPLRKFSLPTGPDLQLYRRARYGRLANFEILDTRQYRTDQPSGDGKKPLLEGAFDPKATLLGDTQERWLMSGLLQSTAQWNILAQQVMMARVDLKAGEESLFSMDQWPGYDVARKRLLKFIADRRVPNPVVLTGDIHSNWVNDLKVDFNYPDDPTVATEFVGTSISSSGNGIDEPKGLNDLLSENPFVKFHNAQRGYVSCEVTPESWRSDYQIVEYVDRPGAPLVTRASFIVENGHPGAERV